MRYLCRAVHPLCASLLLIGGCTTLPDVKPFAESTTALAAAAGTHYHEVADDVASLATEQLPRETDAAFKVRKQTTEDAQKIFRETGRNLDVLFESMVTYSEKLTSLTAAGKTGADAAQSLVDSTNGFAKLAGVTGLPAGELANTVIGGFKAIADEFTKLQAKKSLKEAVDAAQPGVDAVASQFATIYGKAFKNATDSIRNTRTREAQVHSGSNVIGFAENVEQNYNEYYRFLNGIIVVPTQEELDRDNRVAASAWRGFCTQETGPCRAVDELSAVGLVEARMTAIQPIVQKFRDDTRTIDETLSRRRKTSAAVIKAVNAWALEHRKLRASLADGTPLSTFNLKAALLEVEGLLGQKQ